MKKYKLTPLGKFTIGFIFIVVLFVFFNRIANTSTKGITINEGLPSIEVNAGSIAKMDAGSTDNRNVDSTDKKKADGSVKVKVLNVTIMNATSVAKAKASVAKTQPTKVMVNSASNDDKIKEDNDNKENDKKNAKSAIDDESAMFDLRNIVSFMPNNTNIETKENKKSNVEIFYIPHPDDELLSMGVAIAESVKNGREVHVVLYSHGYGSSAIKTINGEVYCQWHKKNHNPKQEGYSKLTEKEFGSNRVKEFVSSAVSLGVRKQNIHILNFYEDSVTPYEVKLVMLGFEKQFPKAFHNTASYHDEHPFHRKIGQALLELYNNKEINAAGFFISPVQWNTMNGEIISNEQSILKVKKSIEVYKLWEPQNEHFGIGYHSYRMPFDKISNKMMSKYHNPND